MKQQFIVIENDNHQPYSLYPLSTIIFPDNEDPVLSSIPANITQNTDPGLPTGVVTWSEPTASDNSGSVTLTSSHESGEAFPIGVTVVTYTAVDAASNMVTSSFAVLIEGMIILFILWCDISFILYCAHRVK